MRIRQLVCSRKGSRHPRGVTRLIVTTMRTHVSIISSDRFQILNRDTVSGVVIDIINRLRVIVTRRVGDLRCRNNNLERIRVGSPTDQSCIGNYRHTRQLDIHTGRFREYTYIVQHNAATTVLLSLKGQLASGGLGCRWQIQGL